MAYSEFIQWQAYFDDEIPDFEKVISMLATFMSMYYDSHKKKGAGRMKPETWLPKRSSAKATTDDQWLASQSSLFLSLGGNIEA